MFNGFRVSVLQDKKLWRWIMATGAQNHECIQDHWTVHLRMFKFSKFSIMCILPQLLKKRWRKAVHTLQKNIKLGEQASSYDRVKSSENSPKTNYKISLNCQKDFRALKLDQTLTEACLLMKNCWLCDKNSGSLRHS